MASSANHGGVSEERVSLGTNASEQLDRDTAIHHCSYETGAASLMHIETCM